MPKKERLVVLFCIVFTLCAGGTPLSTRGMELFYDGSAHAYEQEPIWMVVNGQELQDLAMPPVLFEGSTLVPARDVFEFLGASVYWAAERQEIHIVYYSSIIVLQIDSTAALVNGQSIAMPIPPKLINDKTMIPARFVAENLGMKVEWFQQQRVVAITDSFYTGPPLALESETTERSDLASSQWPPGIPTPEPVGGNPAAGPSGTVTSGGAEGSIEVFEPYPTAAPTPLPAQPPVEDASAYAEADFLNQHHITETEYLDLDKEPLTQSNDVSESEIPAQSFPETRVSGITVPTGAGRDTYVIKADSAISAINKFVLSDNRLVIDIYNAEWNIKSEYLTQSPAVARIRTAQNTVKPQKITRIVFDLNYPVEYSVGISDDRTELWVDLGRNFVTDVLFSQDAESDILTIKTTDMPAVLVYPTDESNKLNVDILLAEMSAEAHINVPGKFISFVSAVQTEDNIARVTLTTTAPMQFTTTIQGTQAIIRFSAPTYKNITYDKQSGLVRLTKHPDFPINISAFTQRDQYYNLQYVINMSGNYESLYGQGEFYIWGDRVQSVLIRQAEGGTELVINEKLILAYDIYEDEQFLYIRPILPKERYARIVILDPGHGGKDNGTESHGLVEKELNLDIVLKMLELFENDPSIKAYSTRVTDVYLDRPQRIILANETGDLLVSVHNNSADRNRVPHGTETYWHPHENDAEVGLSGETVAQTIQSHLLSELGSLDRKVKVNAFDMVNFTTIPAALTEIGFVTNPDEAALLAQDAYRQRAASALYRAVTEIFQYYTPRR
ncbi:MAG: N-acetylmuramoyl-L-alanine amidase family protein [Clostridiales bacterium]|jgi:N-acetylmuramoyl-L-alanine amidase|nr:N-acetylmuramoyl-L-alanine amidase family protein [Clostridiales bacterium]